jgi:flagellar biosynthesis GTPase FlhF
MVLNRACILATFSVLAMFLVTGCRAWETDGSGELGRSVADAEARLADLRSQLDAAQLEAASARDSADQALADAKADSKRAAEALARATSAEETLAAERAAAQAIVKERAAQQAANQAAAQAAENDRAAGTIAKIQNAVDTGRAALDAAVRPDGSVDVGAGLTSLGPLLGPWGIVGASALSLLWGVYERSQRNRDLRSVAVALDRVSTQDGVLNGTLNTAWPKIEEALTPKARAVINETSVT